MTPKSSILGLFIIVIVLGVIAYLFRNPILGINGYGSVNTITATVVSKHIDSSKAAADSSYMVTTDKGTFEVQNGWAQGIYNADVIYGSLVANKTYTFDVKGAERVGYWWGQHYRYIIKATPVNEVAVVANLATHEAIKQNLENRTEDDITAKVVAIIDQKRPGNYSIKDGKGNTATVVITENFNTTVTINLK